MKKRLIGATLMVMLCCALASAQTEWALQVVQTDGQTALYLLSEKPVMKMEADKVTIETTQTTFTYADAEVKEYTFVDGAIVDIKTAEAEADVVVRMDGGVLTVRGAHAVQPVQVYSVGGLLVASGRTVDGQATLSLQQLPAGTYIVKVNGSRTLKFMKR